MATNVEGFSLSHAAILPGNALVSPDNLQGTDIYGIRSGSLSVDTDSYDNTGDNAVLSSWYWFNYGTIAITAGFVSFETLALMTGATVSSTSTEVSMPLWNESSLNQPTRPMLIRVPGKTSDNQVRTLDFVLYKVQFEPISFDGPAYRDGLVLNYGGRALMSDRNEKGDLMTERAIGRLISRV